MQIEEKSKWNRPDGHFKADEKKTDLRRFQNTPRRLKRVKGMPTSSSPGLWFARLFILPHVIIGLCLLVYPFIYLSGIAFGTDAPASIIDKSSRLDEESGRILELEMAYDWAGEKNYKKFSVNRTQYEMHKVGDQVDMHFLPALRDMTLQWKEKGSGVSLPDIQTVLFFGFFAIFWNAVVSVFVLILYVAPVVEWYLLRFGSIGCGQVTGKETEMGSESTTYKVMYNFEAGGKSNSNHLHLNRYDSKIQSTTTVSKQVFDSTSEGESIIVAYSARHPKVNNVVDFSGYEFAG
jgi:hypothetical protein